MTPGRDSLRMSDRQPSNFRATSDNTRFANRMQSTPSTRIPFEEQRRGMEQASRRVLGDQAVGSVPRMTAPDQGGAGRGSVNSRSTTGDPGWRRFGEPVPSRGNSAVAAPAQAAERPGSAGRGSVVNRSDEGTNWRQFGNGSGSRQDSPAAAYRSESNGRGNGNQQQVSPAPSGRSNDGWRGMSGQGPAYRGSEIQQQQRSAPINGYRPDPTPAPVQRQQMQRSEVQRVPSEASRGSFGRSEAIRISPPIVRDRPAAAPAPRSESRPSNNGGGGGGRSSENSGGHNNGNRGGGGGRGR